MRRDDYWNLFWLSGMPEAWLMSRPMEGYLYATDPAAKDLPGERIGPPEEARQQLQNRVEASQNLTAE